MDEESEQDSLTLSDLPGSIIESILMRLPIRDAIRTSLLSSKWRYRWTTIPHLVFDEQCVVSSKDPELIEANLINFITRVLLLHQGPIHKFQISTSELRSSADIDQWILFLSRNDLKQLIIELGENDWFRVPSCLFSCKMLVRLELFRCELDPPVSFNGFKYLKNLNLHQVSVSSDVVEKLILGCPLLEYVELSYLDCLTLSIRAPNLKYLCLEGEFRDISLVNTPLLVGLSVIIYMSDDIVEHEHVFDWNFNKMLGGVPLLEGLIGQVYFTKFLSIGNGLQGHFVTYINLKNIQLYQVSFEDMKEIMVVLRLIMNSPVLEELRISGSSNPVVTVHAPDLNIWTNSDFLCCFSHLRLVIMMEITGVPHEMEFIKFLLRSSPVLEVMSIFPSMRPVDGMLVELLRFRRASSHAEILFTH